MAQKEHFLSKMMASVATAAMAKPMMKSVAKGFGTVSETQKIALDAGSANHEEQFFTGAPDWEKLDDLPLPEMSDDAKKLLEENSEQLMTLVDDWEIRNSDRQDLPDEAWQFLKDNKFFGLVIPKDYEGLGLSAYDHAEIVARIGTFTLPGALTVMVPNSLGPGELIGHYGTQWQKDHFLPRLANGIDIPCFGLTEPNAGSDAAGIQTTGVVFKGEDGTPQIKINGEKRYITLSGDVGTLIGLAIRLEDPDNLLGKGTEPGITCVLVPREEQGDAIDIKRHRPMDIPFQNGQIFIRDAVVSADNIIGGSDMAGEGWRMLMESLGIGRSISLPANSASAGKRTSYAIGAYMGIRQQFGFPLANMKGLQQQMAESGALTYMIDAARAAMALRVDNGERPAIGSAVLKVQATEAMATIVEHGMRLQGGNGVIQGPRNFMGMTPQGEYVGRTVEGDNNMTKSVVIFGQGSKKGHQYLTAEVNAATAGDTKEFKKLFKAHTQDVLDNMFVARKQGKKGYGGSYPDFADSNTAKYFQQMNRVSAAFNFSANLTLALLSKDIQIEQPTSERLGEIYGNMMMAYYTMLHFHKVHKGDEAFLPLVEWVVQTKLHEAEEALEDLIENYPFGGQEDESKKKFDKNGEEVEPRNQRAVKFLLRQVVFPKGRKYKKPSDDLNAKVAEAISTPGKVRDWLRSGMMVPDDKTNVIRHLELAFAFITEKETPLMEDIKTRFDRKEFKAMAEHGQDKFIDALEATDKVTADEVATLRQAQKYRDEVIEVDYFETKDLHKGIVANKLEMR